MLCRRGIEPRFGKWTLPAGFMENGETVEEGAERELFEEAVALAALFDHRQRLVYINPAGAAWLGYSVEELIGQPAVYSSDPQAPSRVSGISPPPEVFQGAPQHGSVISRKAGSPPEHASATFTPLESDVGYSVLVLQTHRAVGIDLTDTDAPCWHEAIHRLRCYQPAEWHHEFLLGNSTAIATFRVRNSSPRRGDS